jgi:hypothetical protein
VRRIAAMSCLLTRCRGKCLLAGLEGIFSEARVDTAGGDLEQTLLVPPDAYWGRYLDFGVPAGGIVPALLGRDRAADIIVNVLLPFYFSRNRSPEAGKALHIFGVYRAPAENGLVKHMRLQFGITRYLTDTARRQQGLIYIYKTQCAEGRCEDCPLG